MLKRQFRLTRDQDFKKIYQKGKIFTEETFIVRSLKNQKDFSRIGIVISKKQYPKAYQRNRTKRQIREAVKRFFSQIQPGFDIIISLKKPLKENKFEKILDSLIKCFKKGKLLND